MIAFPVRALALCVAALYATSAGAQLSIFSGGNPLSAISASLAGLANATPQWVTLGQKGMELRRAGKLEEAASTFKMAVVQLREQEAKSDPAVTRFSDMRVDMQLAYGDVLNRLNRPDESIPILQSVIAIEQELRERAAARTATPMAYTDATASIQATLATAMNAARLLNRKQMVRESDAGDPFEESLAEQLPETLVGPLLLADAYSRKGDRGAVLKLYQEPFQAYLARLRANNDPDARFNLDLAIEASCLRYALILARVGLFEHMEQAFKCVFDTNMVNQRAWGTGATVDIGQENMASQRRLFAGAYADISLNGSRIDAASQRRIVQLIADSKGLHTRYAQRVRTMLYKSSNAKLVGLRPRFAALEDELKNLPIYEDQGVRAFVDWQNRRAALMTQALPHLNAEGIGRVFQDGSEILARAQRRLNGSAVIGYSIYKPIDLFTMKPKAGRVLRYTVTADAIDVRDIGSQAELERLITGWRGAILSGGESATVVRMLSQRLLGELPSAVMFSKRWLIDPDGAISLVPVEALYSPDGGMVIAERQVSYITSLASYAEDSAPTGRQPASGALVIADPEFGAVAGLQQTPSVLRSIPTASGALLTDTRFARLPHTASEASKVQEVLDRLGVKAEMKMGRQATLDALHFTSSPRFLHIATHGVYMAPGADPQSREFVRVATVIPGMQSALVLAPSGSGSIFTSADFARLPLSGTELVVLSACDTGNGAASVGESVDSLRKAVEDAGAKSVVSSLWPVPSEATATLMALFYEQLGRGASKSEALRSAKLSLMKTHPSPVNWAGFLLSGQP